jgi:hypothetical protein
LCPRETSGSGKPKTIFWSEQDAWDFIRKNEHRYGKDREPYQCSRYRGHHWHIRSTRRPW